MNGFSLVFVYVALVWFRLKASAGRRWRNSALEAAVLLGGITIALTETLGVCHLLNPAWVSLVWILAGAAALIYLWSELRVPNQTSARINKRAKLFSFSRLFSSWSVIELVTLCVVVGGTGLIAWCSPPTNYDSMTYQLPRIMHWFHQGTLEHYPTPNVRQLSYGPGAAYWQVQLWALFGGDVAANMPQWAALVGCAVALTVWIQRFFGREAVGLSVIAALTMPMALLQASSSQTDLQVGCWLLVAAVFLTNRDRFRISSAILVGLAIGLAIITKPSAGLLIIPIASVAFCQTSCTNGFKAGIKTSMIWIVMSLLICAPHFSRNCRWFGNPVGNDSGTVVTSMSPALFVANGARWLALEIPSMSAWRNIAKGLELSGINPNDPAITFLNYKFAPPSRYVVYRLLLPDEDFAGYTFTLFLIVLLTIAARVRRVQIVQLRPSKLSSVAPWAVAIFGMLVMNILFLKWQFWGNRLLLPWTLFACPFLMATTRTWQRPLLRTIANLLMLAQALFVLSFSLNRPLVSLPVAWRYTGATALFSVSRTDFFYSGYNSETLPVCRQLVAVVHERHWHNVGLVIEDGNYPEYPLWKALHDAGFDDVALHYTQARPPAGYRGEIWPPAVDGYIQASSSAEGR